MGVDPALDVQPVSQWTQKIIGGRADQGHDGRKRGGCDQEGPGALRKQVKCRGFRQHGHWDGVPYSRSRSCSDRGSVGALAAGTTPVGVMPAAASISSRVSSAG